jgi:Transposase C of IS166 homeodomain
VHSVSEGGDQLPTDVAALQALLVAARAERDAAIAERDQVLAQNDRLQHLLHQLERMQFGRRSEKLDPDQLQLAFEDVEQAVAATEAADDKHDLVKARIFGTDLPDVKLSLDSLAVMEAAMRHFYLTALIEKSAGEHADWEAVDAAMVQAASIAKEVAAYRHAKRSAVRLAGELKHGPADGATLNELIERIRSELVKLGPILQLEVVREPVGSRTEGGLTN